ncbi:hypothetical protein P9112_002593 [Eukaryota sp. TZLM1-RC]
MLVKFLLQQNLESPIITSIPNTQPISSCLPTLAVKTNLTIKELESRFFYKVRSLKDPSPDSRVTLDETVDQLQLSFSSAILVCEEERVDLPPKPNTTSLTSKPPSPAPAVRTSAPHSTLTTSTTQTFSPQTQTFGSNVCFECPECARRSQLESFSICTQTLKPKEPKVEEKVFIDEDCQTVQACLNSIQIQTEEEELSDGSEVDESEEEFSSRNPLNCSRVELSLEELLPLKSNNKPVSQILNDSNEFCLNDSRSLSMNTSIRPKSLSKSPKLTPKFKPNVYNVKVLPLPPSLREESVLRRAFGSFGSILSVELGVDKEGVSALITFSNRNSAISAVEALNNVSFDSAQLKVVLV